MFKKEKPEGRFVEHISKWGREGAPMLEGRGGRLFSRNTTDKEFMTPEKNLQKEMNQDASEYIKAFNSPDSTKLLAFYERIGNKLKQDLSSKPSWKELDIFKTKIDQSSEEEVKTEITMSYIFQLVTIVVTTKSKEMGSEEQAQKFRRESYASAKEYFPITRARSGAVFEETKEETKKGFTK